MVPAAVIHGVKLVLAAEWVAEWGGSCPRFHFPGSECLPLCRAALAAPANARAAVVMAVAEGFQDQCLVE
jgi:hypothetical protein